MAETDQEKTEEASSYRREEYRRKGQVAQTKELGTVFSLLASALLVWMVGRQFIQHSQSFMHLGLTDFIKKIMTGATPGEILKLATFEGAKILLPVFLLFFIISILSSVLQVGFVTNEEALDLNFERLNPVEGTKRVFSLKSLVEGLKSLMKMGLVGYVLYTILKKDINFIPHLGNLQAEQLMMYLGAMVVKMLATIGVLMGVLAAADYFYQRWTLEKQMRMTKQEVKEEHKSREGDPHIKAKIRRIQREMSNRRMMDAIPKADVVITNPTHIAVVLKYDPTQNAAPQLVAKGADLVAQKIREMAREHNIPIIENKPLARTIYKTLKIGQVVPRELFNAVAQVLSYVYKLKRKKMRF